MTSTAVIIARFQTPFLHEGHHALIREISEQHHKVIVVLGVAPVRHTRRNPFDFYTRERMLRQAYPQLFILALADHRSDEQWSANLDHLLQSNFPDEQFTLYGSRDSFISYYSGKLHVKEIATTLQQSATQIRERYADQVRETEDFRMGINYACQHQYQTVYPTVDIAAMRFNRTEVLLGRKPGAQGWRFPGGFADVRDEDFETSAQRELLEETGLHAITMQYIASARINDWRYRHEDHKITTILFITDTEGEAIASDDLSEVKWFPVDQLPGMIDQGLISQEHEILMNKLTHHLQTSTLTA